MSQILVRDLDPDVVERLKKRAKANRRSLQAEVRTILEEVAERESRRVNLEDLLRIADAIKERSGPQTTDSTAILRDIRGD
jgi:plasmid stability protein